MPIYKKKSGYGIRNVNATYSSLAQAKRALKAIKANQAHRGKR